MNIEKEESKEKDSSLHSGDNAVKPNAYRVEDENNLDEEDLKRTFLFGKGQMKDTREPGMEGQGMGGQSFGKNNITPAGNDRDNPAQNAGEGNAYFRRREPAEEHPENENFVAREQKGGPGKDQKETNEPRPGVPSDQKKAGEGTKKEGQQKPEPQQDYSEGTADNDGS